MNKTEGAGDASRDVLKKHVGTNALSPVGSSIRQIKGL